MRNGSSGDVRVRSRYPIGRSYSREDEGSLRPRRGSSPPRELERSQRVVRGRRSDSGERGDHLRRFDEDLDDDYLRGFDEDLDDDRVSRRMSKNEHSRNYSQFDQGISQRGSPNIDHIRKYMMPEGMNSNADVNHGLNHHADSTLRINGENHLRGSGSSTHYGHRENHLRGNGSSTHYGHRKIVCKSAHLDEESVPAFYPGSSSLKPGRDGGDLFSPSTGTLNVGFHRDEDMRYRSSLHSNKYKEEQNSMFCSRGVPYPPMANTQAKAFQNTLSAIRKEDLVDSGNFGGNMRSYSLGNFNASLHNGEDVRYREDLNPHKLPTRESYNDEGSSSRHVLYPNMTKSQSTAYQASSSAVDAELKGSFHDNQYNYASSEVSAREQKYLLSYQQGSHSSSRVERQAESYHERDSRERNYSEYPSDLLFANMEPTTRRDYVNNSRSSHGEQLGAGLQNQHSLQEKPLSYLNVKNVTPTPRTVEPFNTESKYLEFGLTVSADYKISTSNSDRSFGREAGSISGKELSNPELSGCDTFIYESERNAGRGLMAGEMCDQSERLNKRKCIVGGETSVHDHISPEDIGVYGQSQRLHNKKYFVGEEMRGYDPRSTDEVAVCDQSEWFNKRNCNVGREMSEHDHVSPGEIGIYDLPKMLDNRKYIYGEDMNEYGPKSPDDADMSDRSKSLHKRNYIGEEMSEYDPRRGNEVNEWDQSDRLSKKKHIVGQEMSKNDYRNTLSSSGDRSRRMQELMEIAEQCIEENPGRLSSSRRFTVNRDQFPKASRTFTSREPPSLVQRRRTGSHFSGQKLSVKERLTLGPTSLQDSDYIERRDALQKPYKISKGSLDDHYKPHFSGGRKLSVKNRLNLDHKGFHISDSIERGDDIQKPFKYRRGNHDNNNVKVNALHGDPLDQKMLLVKPDPLEETQEFKQLVHKAFLQFSKQLNENPAHRKRYKEQGNAGCLICSVCSSSSKEFMDTRSLGEHTFMSQKVGMRADHLGLHKALCVLMGWNSGALAGDTWIHQPLPKSEALALKEDLVLWPPLVVIHNSSIGKKNPDERKIVTIEGMEAILRDIGFSEGTTKVCRGKAANQSVMVVKFMPTFSGLQEAERLHMYFTENKRGRQEFQHIDSKNVKCNEESGQTKVDKVDNVLYGHLGIADDLEKLDFETKKKCKVKSRKMDIQDIADATLSN